MGLVTIHCNRACVSGREKTSCAVCDDSGRVSRVMASLRVSGARKSWAKASRATGDCARVWRVCATGVGEGSSCGGVVATGGLEIVVSCGFISDDACAISCLGWAWTWGGSDCTAAGKGSGTEISGTVTLTEVGCVCEVAGTGGFASCIFSGGAGDDSTSCAAGVSDGFGSVVASGFKFSDVCGWCSVFLTAGCVTFGKGSGTGICGAAGLAEIDSVCLGAVCGDAGTGGFASCVFSGGAGDGSIFGVVAATGGSGSCGADCGSTFVCAGTLGGAGGVSSVPPCDKAMGAAMFFLGCCNCRWLFYNLLFVNGLRACLLLWLWCRLLGFCLFFGDG